MSPSDDCTQNTDPLKLVREGTSQAQRLIPALKPLDPAYPLVAEHAIEHQMVFAQAYSEFLKYYDLNNAEAGDWKPFFSEDAAVLLAVAAVQDVEYYRQTVREYLNFLNDLGNENDKAGLRDRLDYLFSCCATLSIRLDFLKEKLPAEIALKKVLQNLVQSKLAPALMQLIAYRKGGEAISDAEKPINTSVEEKAAPIRILCGDAIKFSGLGAQNLSKDWTNDKDWATYYGDITGDDSVYGSLVGTKVFDRANHFVAHNFFTSILDQFLKVYARIAGDAKAALEENLTNCDCHQPHYALFLAFLRLFEYSRAEMNTLTGRHLDFYYREILRLKEKAAEPAHAHLLVEPAKQIDSYEFKTGALFKAGKDDLGIDAFFANDRDFIANQAKTAALKTVYRHKNSPNDTLPYQNDRLFASPVANSDDGLGAKLTSADQSWHPFYNKIYQDGALSEIKMPQAQVGFAVASHYLRMAEGDRFLWAEINVSGYSGATFEDFKNKITCRLTSEKGWIEKEPIWFFPVSANIFWLLINIGGSDPPITPYLAKTHGQTFDTDLPVLIVELKHEAADEYAYSIFQDLTVKSINLNAFVFGLKTLAVSNDFGPVDTSKPFQPFGAQPTANSALVIGSKEVFQKKLYSATVNVKWQSTPKPYPSDKAVNVITEYLQAGTWQKYKENVSGYITGSSFAIIGEPESPDKPPYVDAPDLSEPEGYNTSSRYGFARLSLDKDFGQNEYEQALINYIKLVTDSTADNEGTKPVPPIGPFITELTIDYIATQTINLDSAEISEFEKRQSQFIHIAPFGQAEQHPFLNSGKKVYLLPQFELQRDNIKQESEAEFYLGISALKPPQSLALLFQVADGTADPLSIKPDPHIHWSYLRDNEWISFADNDVYDHTGGLLNSGIITFAIPRDASDTNTLLPTGMHWIRAAVESESDAVCRMLMVAAQSLEVTFTDKGNDPAFPAKVLQSGTISKLDQPDAAVKKITQPFASFGGRGKEAPAAFYTRISERLRHKDRAIALWDYERLVLEAFPQIYKAKCLNHTQFEPNESGTGIYRELAPGHVTVVTIPNQQFHNLRDPLRPYTSLGLLEEIESFLSRRLSCFVKLHVKNPQFEEVKVDFKVRLYDGFDETFYVNKLDEAITRFLSPWAFTGGGAPSFGGKVYKSVLINFVEEQPYVDYITDFQLFHSFLNINNIRQTDEKNEVQGSKAVSILVSARKHNITTFKPAEVQTPGEKCLCAE